MIDVFYKIKSLHQLGIKIHLHCFEYGRGEPVALNDYCEKVYYYHRNEGHKGFSHKLPYIVCSRSANELRENLLKDDYPILMEGIHCTYLICDGRFAERKIILRLHNVEHEYYHQLYKHESSLLKKIYFFHESSVLKKYERDVSGKVMTLAMSEGDVLKYSHEFNSKNIFYLPAFHQVNELKCSQGTGCFCLYHGNLSVAENESVAIWLLRKVFNDIDVPFVIAGKKPSERLRRIAGRFPSTCIVADPDVEAMEDMVAKAQINITPSFNCTGIKLKVLNAVFAGRHCIANEQAVAHTGLEKYCHIAKSPSDFKKLISELYLCPFAEEEANKRKELLEGLFNNKKNGERLIGWLW